MADEEKKKEETVIIKREETSVGYQRDLAPTEFAEGFSLRSVIGAFFIGFVMMPAAIYLGLVAGQGLGPAAQWVTIILFMEVVRRSFGVLKKQEIYVLYYMAGSLVGMAGGLALSGGAFAWLIWNQYILQSPASQGFGIIEHLKNEGINWIAPFPGSEAIIKRTFFHKDWWPAITLLLIGQVLGRLNWFGLGYFVFRLTSDVERLPFPMAPVAAQGATALAEVSGKRETWRWRVFSIGSVIGVAFGFIYIFIPSLSGALFNKPFQILPIPFIDLTQNSEGILPAALTGLNTDLGTMLVGFVLPFPIVVGTFIASVTCQIGINPFLQRAGLLTTWRKGMGSIPTSMANSIDFWLSVGIGISLAIGVIGIISVIKAMGKKREKTERGTFAPIPGRGDIPILLVLGMFVTGTIGYIIVCNRLVPLFPIWLLVFYGFVWTPLNTYVSARMIGLTGRDQFDFPYLREATFILSGYKGVGIWFAPIPMADYSGVAARFREVELTGTKFTSIIKAEVLMLPLMLLCSLIFWSFLWKMGPIPSVLYPFAAKFWPLYSTFQCLWATSTVEGTNWLLKAIKPEYIITGGAIAGGLYGLISWLGLPILLFYGLCSVAAWPHHTVPMFFGAMLGRFYFRKLYGAERWRAYAPVLLAGYFCGMGLMGMCGVATALISKSVYQMPF